MSLRLRVSFMLTRLPLLAQAYCADVYVPPLTPTSISSCPKTTLDRERYGPTVFAEIPEEVK